MSVLDEIENDVIDLNKSISTALMKTKNLAFTLKNDELKKWVNNELNGYKATKDEIPEYRIFQAINYGNFVSPTGKQIKNAPIPFNIIPDKFLDNHKVLKITHSIPEIETFHSYNQDMRVQWVPDILPYLKEYYADCQCLQAWTVVSISYFTVILNKVRNTLQDIVLDLKEKYPDITSNSDKLTDIPTEYVNKIVNNIYGDGNIITSGSNISNKAKSNINKDDIESLLNYAKDLGFSENDVNELKIAVENDKSDAVDTGIGEKIKKWFSDRTNSFLDSKISSIDANTITALLMAIKQYFGN